MNNWKFRFENLLFFANSSRLVCTIKSRYLGCMYTMNRQWGYRERPLKFQFTAFEGSFQVKYPHRSWKDPDPPRGLIIEGPYSVSARNNQYFSMFATRSFSNSHLCQPLFRQSHEVLSQFLCQLVFCQILRRHQPGLPQFCPFDSLSDFWWNWAVFLLCKWQLRGLRDRHRRQIAMNNHHNSRLHCEHPAKKIIDN